MLIAKGRCVKCRSERGVRECLRLRGKVIGWSCCNGTRIRLACPTQCPYAAQSAVGSPFPSFRADSVTEFVDAAKRYIDLWIHQPQTALNGLSPLRSAEQDKDATLDWLQQYQYPANYPLMYLLDKLDLPHEEITEPVTPESVACGFLDAVLAQDWPALRAFTPNVLDWPELIRRYEKLLSGIKELQHIRHYSILHAGAADDGISAIVVLELNYKKLWTILLSSNAGSWKVRQNLGGAPDLYYAQNELFRKLADSLANAREHEARELLQAKLPLYPDCADLYYYRSFVWQLASQPERTESDLLNALALDNHYFAAGFTLATQYLAAKRLTDALPLLQILVKDRPDDLNARNNLAACEAGLGNLGRARQIWQEILKSAPNYEPAQKNLERYRN